MRVSFTRARTLNESTQPCGRKSTKSMQSRLGPEIIAFDRVAIFAVSSIHDIAAGEPKFPTSGDPCG